MNFPKKIKSNRIELTGVHKPTFELANEIYHHIEESRAHLEVFLPWADTTKSPEDEFVALKDFAQGFDQKTNFAYIIREKNTHRFLGCIELMNVDTKNLSAEIGYWLSKKACGNGYMLEAVRALEKVAFEKGINRIVIRNDVKNIKSAHVARNAGYHLDGVLREIRFNDKTKQFDSSNVWSKLKSEA
ncbi:MAG: GNAT family N-acetyltransferase [Alphaproteobacteria bacterium]|nr:GNAT family N-acetyltransferase [Alphaproteobacteria bacterium]